MNEEEKSGEGIDPEIVNDDEIVQAEEPPYVRRQFRLEAWIGPLPEPSDFQAYEEVAEGTANRIMGMAEKQSDHRISIEEKKLDRSYWGLVAGFIIAMTALIGGIIVILNGYPWAGFGIISVDIASLVSLFMYRGKTPRNVRPKTARGQVESSEFPDDQP